MIHDSEVIFRETVDHLDFDPDTVDLRDIYQKHEDFMLYHGQKEWANEIPRKIHFKHKNKRKKAS